MVTGIRNQVEMHLKKSHIDTQWQQDGRHHIGSETSNNALDIAVFITQLTPAVIQDGHPNDWNHQYAGPFGTDGTANGNARHHLPEACLGGELAMTITRPR